MSTADRPHNVLVLPGGGGAGMRQSAFTVALQATVRRLDELACSLQQFSPRMNWSAQRCMIASTSFRIRLAGMRKRLDDLVTSRPLSTQDGTRWALELNDACLEAARRMHDIDVCLHTLQGMESSPLERGRGIEMFASNGSELLAILSEIRQLITNRPTSESSEY